MSIFKRFIFLSFSYGYLTKTTAIDIQTNIFPSILILWNSNPLIQQKLFQSLTEYFDELVLKYHQNSVSLKLLCIRKIRQSMAKVNQKKSRTIETQSTITKSNFTKRIEKIIG